MSDKYNDREHSFSSGSFDSNGAGDIFDSVSSENSEKSFDYRANSTESKYDTSSSYAFTSENSEKPAKKKKNTVLKVAVAVLAVAVLGFCGVKAYKFLRATKDELVAEYTGIPSRTVPEKPVEDKSADTDKEPLPSLIELASRSDAKPLPDIVDSIMPSVVGVASTFEYEQEQTFSIWGWNPQPQIQRFRTTGTGFVITEDGYIVTNSHVVYDEEYKAGEAIDVSVLFSDETEHEASIIAYDPETDIAVLKVDEKGLTPAVLGDSDELRVGELVIAVGNPLGFDLFGTVTSGIVSALNRKININEKKMNLIQTDAAINSGNSGGPLLNSCGQVIGINSAKISSSYSSSSASVEGLCFAIPIKEAKSIIDDLINYKYVTGRPQLGIISTKDITEAESRYWDIPVGVFVISMQEDGAADLAGIKIGDVIIDIEGEAVATTQELNEIKNKYKAGDTVNLTVSRNGMDIKIKVTLQEAKNVTAERKNTRSDIKETSN
jgi:serine protease Do